jgi:hypothetical protein
MFKTGIVLKYDIFDRVIYMKLPYSTIEYFYKYSEDDRICEIKSNENKSNNTTTIFQKFINDKYVDIKKIENGEVYNSEIFYDKNGLEIEIERINNIKNTHYNKTIFRNKKGDAIIWIEQYNKEKTIGFKIDLKKIIN